MAVDDTTTALDARLAEIIRRNCDECWKLIIRPCYRHRDDRVFDTWPTADRRRLYDVAADVTAWAERKKSEVRGE